MIVYIYQRIDTRYGEFPIKVFSSANKLARKIKNDHDLATEEDVQELCDNSPKGQWIGAARYFGDEERGIVFQATIIDG